MNRYPGVILFALAVLALISTAESVYERPMDGLSVAWFSSHKRRCIRDDHLGSRRAFRRQELRSTFDQFYGVLFLALPLSIGFFLAAIPTLTWYFFGWE